MGVEGADVYVQDDGVIVYRASALGMCTKRLVHARLGDERVDVEFPAWTAGQAAEDWLADREKWQDVNRDVRLEMEVMPGVIVRGHVDHYVYRKSFVEIKSMSGMEWDKFWAVHGESNRDGKELVLDGSAVWSDARTPLWGKYAWQMSAYMHATRTPLSVAIINRDTLDVGFLLLNKPVVSRGRIARKILEIELLARDLDVPVACDLPGYPCPYFYAHDENREEMEDERLMYVVGLYQRAKAKADVWAKAKSKAYDELKKMGVGKYETDREKVTVYERKDKSLDREALDAFLETYDKGMKDFQKETVRTQVRITPKKVDGE